MSSVEEESEPEYHQLFEYAFVVGLREGKEGEGEVGGRRKEREFEEEGGERVRGGRVSMRKRKEEGGSMRREMGVRGGGRGSMRNMEEA